MEKCCNSVMALWVAGSVVLECSFMGVACRLADFMKCIIRSNMVLHINDILIFCITMWMYIGL